MACGVFAMRCLIGYSSEQHQPPRDHDIHPYCQIEGLPAKNHSSSRGFASKGGLRILRTGRHTGEIHLRFKLSRQMPYEAAIPSESYPFHLKHCAQWRCASTQGLVDAYLPRTPRCPTRHHKAGLYQRSVYQCTRENHMYLLVFIFFALLLVPGTAHPVKDIENRTSWRLLEAMRLRMDPVKRSELGDEVKTQYASRRRHKGLSRRSTVEHISDVELGNPPILTLQKRNHMADEVGNALRDVIVSLIESKMGGRPSSEQHRKFEELWDAAKNVIPPGASARSLAIELDRAERMLQSRVSRKHQIKRAQVNQWFGLKIAHTAYVRVEKLYAPGADSKALRLEEGLSVNELGAARGRARRKTSPPESEESTRISRRPDLTGGNGGTNKGPAAEMSPAAEPKGPGDVQAPSEIFNIRAHGLLQRQTVERNLPGSRRGPGGSPTSMNEMFARLSTSGSSLSSTPKLWKRGNLISMLLPDHELDNAVHRVASEMAAEAPTSLARSNIHLPGHRMLTSQFERLAHLEMQRLPTALTSEEVRGRLAVAEQWRGLSDPREIWHRPATLRAFGRKVLKGAFKLLEREHHMSRGGTVVYPEHHRVGNS